MRVLLSLQWNSSLKKPRTGLNKAIAEKKNMAYNFSGSPINRNVPEDVSDNVNTAGLSTDKGERICGDEFTSLVVEVLSYLVRRLGSVEQGSQHCTLFTFPASRIGRRKEESRHDRD